MAHFDSKMSILILVITTLFTTTVNAQQRNCSCVAFRLDDIQDWWVREGQIAIMEVFKAEGVPLTIGVIANITGDDPTIVRYITDAVAAGYVELSSHGYNHEDFSTFSRSEQTELLTLSVGKIEQLFGVRTSIFIPPYNAFNTNTLIAMNATNLTVLSSEVDLDGPPYSFDAPHLWRFPIGAATANSANEDVFEPVSHEVTLADAKSQLSRFGFAAVMMHPMEFHVYDPITQEYGALNQSHIEELRTLIRKLKAENIAVTGLGGIRTLFDVIPTTGVATTGTTGTTAVLLPPTTGATTAIPTTGTTAVPTPSIVTTGEVTTGTTAVQLPVTTGQRTPSPISHIENLGTKAAVPFSLMLLALYLMQLFC